MRRLTVVVVTVGLLLAGCTRTSEEKSGATNATKGTAGLPARSVTVDKVTVKAQPKRMAADGAVIDIIFDTHTTPLDMALPSAANLIVAGRPWRPTAWDGDGPGGHHRQGTLRFLPSGPVAGTIELSIGGFSRPATFRWTR